MAVDVRVAYQEMLAEIVLPLLTERGFAEVRGRYLRMSGNGDAVSLWFAGSQVTFPGQVAFFVNVDAATGHWVEYRRRENPAADVTGLLGQVYGRVQPGDDFAFHRGSDDWNLRHAEAAPAYGAEVRRLLDETVLPGLEQHLVLNAALERAIAGGAVQSAFPQPPTLPGVINRMSYLEEDDGYVWWLRRTGPLGS